MANETEHKLTLGMGTIEVCIIKPDGSQGQFFPLGRVPPRAENKEDIALMKRKYKEKHPSRKLPGSTKTRRLRKKRFTLLCRSFISGL